MSTYVLVSFWMTAFAIGVRMIELLCRDHWPHEKKVTLGAQIVTVLLSGAFMFWAGYLLWWGPR